MNQERDEASARGWRPVAPTAKEALALGFIHSADCKVTGRQIYATAAWAEALEDRGECDWRRAAWLLAAAAREQLAGASAVLPQRLRMEWRLACGASLPTTVAVQPSAEGDILVMLDGE